MTEIKPYLKMFDKYVEAYIYSDNNDSERHIQISATKKPNERIYFAIWESPSLRGLESVTSLLNINVSREDFLDLMVAMFPDQLARK